MVSIELPAMPHLTLPSARLCAPLGTCLLVATSFAACGDDDRGGEDTPPDDGVSDVGDDDDDDQGDDDDDDDCPEGGCLDIGEPDDDDDDDDESDCDDGDDYEFNVIWVANTAEGTVSKIDTVLGQELARYRTGPSGQESPSRTSVNLRGDVAVGNRDGSIMKIIEKATNCVDQNGNGLQTSSGPTDVLPWGEDDCVAWFHDLPFSGSPPDFQGGPRAIAWDFHQGDSGPDGDTDCYGDPRLWIGWRNQPDSSITLRRLDGQTGESQGEAIIDNWQGNWGHGSYGGAIDPEGHFWALGTLGTLVRVHGETMEVTRWDHPSQIIPYGLAIDADGTPWMGGWDGHIYAFNRQSETFVDKGMIQGGPSMLRGLAIDETGHAWIAGNSPCGLVRYDTIAEAVVDANISLPGCGEPVGVSIDSDGDVWVVDRMAQLAYEVEPIGYATRTVSGLVGPYTYSDMTGAGLSLVVPPVE